jgi:hypothetical protein
MNRVRLIDLHDDELLELIRKAQQPLVEEIAELRALLIAGPKEVLTVADVARLQKRSTDTVRRWITEGVTIRGEVVKLNATPGVGPSGGRSGYRIHPKDVEEFVSRIKLT